MVQFDRDLVEENWRAGLDRGRAPCGKGEPILGPELELELGRELEREPELEQDLELEFGPELEHELERELKLGRERSQEQGKGVYKMSGAAGVRQAAPSASTSPPAPLHILLLVGMFLNLHPVKGFDPEWESLVERWPQRRQPYASLRASFGALFRLLFRAISCAVHVSI